MNVMQQLLTEHLDIWTAAETEKKSGRGRAAGNAGSVYGIKKLRELILELAVHGKLVPQDANDEPASELLKRIQTEKAKLITNGKIKKEKSLPAVKPEDISYQLPYGWKWVRFGDIAQHNSGKTLDSGRNTGVLHDYITTSNLYWGCFELANVRQMPIRDDEFEKCSAKNGDLLICEGGEAGRAAVWFYEKEVCFQNHIHRARFFCEISPYYAYRFFEKINATGEINQHRKGVGISNMSGKTLSSIIFPLPPIAEQHRIVAKVDELMALCDQLEARHSNAADAHEKLVSHLLGTLTQSQNAADFSANWQRIAAHFDTLFTTEASIDALKQTLLQLAVMGKLVPQDVNDEPASELLKRIKTEKARLIAEGKIKKDKPPEATAEDEKSFDLPQEWEWVTLDEISQVGTGATPLRTRSEYFNPPSISWVTSGETSDSYIFETEQYVSALALKETNLTVYPKGTLIIAMYGQGKTRGQITELMIDACTNQACAAIRLFSSDEFHRKYVKLFFEKIYEEIRELAAGGAQPNLNLSKVKETRLPLPPLSEQHRIVAKVDELMALCDQLKSRITGASQLQKKLADVLVEQVVA